MAALRAQAECLYRLHRNAEAIGRLEEASRLPVAPYTAEDAAYGQALLGMLRRDPVMVRAAVAVLAAPETEADLDDPRYARIAAWLTQHGS